MAYTPRTRDRHRFGVSVATGATTTAVALTATGWVMGAAAHDYEAHQAARAAQQREAEATAARQQAEYLAALELAKPRVVIVGQRPRRVHVITRYVRAAAPAAPSAGGTVRAPSTYSAPSAPSAPSGGGGGPTGRRPPSTLRLLRHLLPRRRPRAAGHDGAATARFPAWSTYVFLAVRDDRHLADARGLTDEVLGEIDRTCSRFRDDSDLSRVNRRPGAWVDVDPTLARAVSVAVEAATESDGLVDPLLGHRWSSSATTGTSPSSTRSRTCRRSSPCLSSPARTRRGGRSRSTPGRGPDPRGTALDLGSTGKAWAADLVATACTRRTRRGRAGQCGRGHPHPGAGAAPWPVGITEGDDPPDEQIEVARGGLATRAPRSADGPGTAPAVTTCSTRGPTPGRGFRR